MLVCSSFQTHSRENGYYCLQTPQHHSSTSMYFQAVCTFGRNANSTHDRSLRVPSWPQGCRHIVMPTSISTFFADVSPEITLSARGAVHTLGRLRVAPCASFQPVRCMWRTFRVWPRPPSAQRRLDTARPTSWVCNYKYTQYSTAVVVVL